ncbi:MAG TPA: M28 family peptidase [Candidatus Limnocylindrales bacterium]|nr:M28 family peptidase [Candidatus Limnocylindrales bacterium]
MPTGSPASALGSPASGGLADAVRSGISVHDILDDLGELQQIADANGGNRAAGSPGFDTSADFVAEELGAAGFTVVRQPVTLTAFSQTAPSEIEIPGGPALEDVHDFKAMTYSASGDVTAQVVALGWDPNATPESRTGLGCAPGDWVAFPAGAIALVQPGPCRRHDAVVLAQDAGAVAMVTTYAGWARDAILRPTLVVPEDIDIPVIGATHAVGLALAQAAASGTDVHVSAATSVQTVQSANVIGESTWGDPAHVVMLGGHLDSVFDGPGINDNGSGTMTVLEIARTLADLAQSQAAGAQPRWKVRVAFWTGEEEGLFGSGAYAGGLTEADRIAIHAYLNFDMVGSRNGVRVVYQETGATRPTDEATIGGLFGQALDSEQLAWEPEAIGGASDHFPLEQAGIAIGGLYSGANEVMTAEEAGKFTGAAGTPEDACYHLACDTTANVDADLLGELARAAAWVTGRLASGEVVLAGS